MIKIEKLSKSFGSKKVLDDFSCEIPEPGLTVISGASGIGKTTLARLIAGLETADSGSITGTDDRKISVVFQEDRLFPHLTALENAAIASDAQTAERILTAFGLGGDLDKKPSELSGGMCRRVAIARALAYGGDLLILDEPFKGLDEKLRADVFEAVMEFSKKSAVILISHDSGFDSYANKIIEL